MFSDLKKTQLSVEEAIRIICSCQQRDGSVDEVVVERGAHLLQDGCTMSAQAFGMFAMHLDPDSRFAPAYHEYALKHFQNDDVWNEIAGLARIGTPLRTIGSDPLTRQIAVESRQGRPIPSARHAAQFATPAKAPHRIQSLMRTLKRTAG